MESTRTDTICEINLDRICWNAGIFARLAGGKDKVCGVLKADAYGHGAEEVMGCLLDFGIERFAVANLHEALKLRERWKEGSLQVLGKTPDRLLSLAAENNIIVSVCEARQAEILQRSSPMGQFYIKVDTGMHRFGLSTGEEGMGEARQILKIAGENCVGIFSHLAQKSGEEDRAQYGRFRQFMEDLCFQPCGQEGSGRTLESHILESHTALKYPEMIGSAIRVGAGLYGYGENRDLLPAMKVESRVCLLRRIAAGEGVGYGLTDAADRDRVLAVLPFGYADGIPSSFGNGVGFVTICGKAAPYVGKLSMDSCLVDVTGIEGVEEGSRVAVLDAEGEGMTLVRGAAMAGRMRPELQAGIAERVERVYRRNTENLK